MQLFEDFEDFGAFDDAVSGDVRDPYAELAERRREGAIQKLDMSGMPQMEDSKPIFMGYGFDQVEAVLKDNETFSSSIILAVFGDVLGEQVMLGMDEPEHRRLRALVSGAFSKKWSEPERFDIFRRALPHIGYGHGVHVCLGMHLARLEMSTALNLFFDRLPDLRLDPDGDDPHIRGQVFRSPTSLPVLFDVPRA